MKHRLLYTSPFCVITEGIPPVPSWVHNQVQEALSVGISPALVNKVAMLHLPHLLETAKASTVAAKTRTTAFSTTLHEQAHIATDVDDERERERHDAQTKDPCQQPEKS